MIKLKQFLLYFFSFTPAPAEASYNKVNGISIKGTKPRERVEKPFVSILPALLKTFGGTFFFGAALKVIPDLLVFVSPQILK